MYYRDVIEQWFNWCFCFQQAFSQYLAYRRDNNELLLFVLKQLSKEQITFFRSRYRSEPEVIEIQEDEFTDRVRKLRLLRKICTLKAHKKFLFLSGVTNTSFDSNIAKKCSPTSSVHSV